MADAPLKAPVARPGVMSLTIKDSLGDEVFLLLTLLDEPTKYTVTGKVIWLTPPGAQGSRSQGVGIQFSNNEFGIAAKNKIEAILGGHLQSNRSTHTM